MEWYNIVIDIIAAIRVVGVEYITLVYEPTIEDYKRDKIREIIRYDSSSEVNKCYIKTAGTELSYWANKSERSSLNLQ